MVFDPSVDARTLDDALNGTPGVVEHGIFRQLASTVLIAAEGKIEERQAAAR
jgi:ribose 5-phosphate isomerase A